MNNIYKLTALKLAGKQKGWFSPEPLDRGTPRPATREHLISNMSADYVISNMSADHVIQGGSQRAVKLNYSAHQT